MFDTLFCRPAALRRHRDGPLAAERAEYLDGLIKKGMTRSTVLSRACYVLAVAEQLQRWPPGHSFDEEDLAALAGQWVSKRPRQAHRVRSGSQFTTAARGFLETLGRLRSVARVPGRYATAVERFIDAQRIQERWLSTYTVRTARWQLDKFFEFMTQRAVSLEDLTAEDLDAYLHHASGRWSRTSLRITGSILRAWLTYCESMGWVRSGLAGAVLLPRVYRQEDLPLGPTWEEVGRMLQECDGDELPGVRDRAILLLTSVYGLRSVEVRGLRLEDLDWHGDRIHVVRRKGGSEEWLPLERSVGDAIARYLLHGRPKGAQERWVFLTVRAPHRALSLGGLYSIVRKHVSKRAAHGRGPHALRHACARHLLESGRSYKEIGDHLGHRSAEATRIYAKVDLVALRRAVLDLGGLS